MVEKLLMIVGLGNPGNQYAMTRHNMGFLVVKALARKLGWSLKEESRFNAYTAKGSVEEASVHLVLPTTFMNLSGIAVRRYMDYYKLAIGQLVVVADDVALDFGEMRLRVQGSAGGHNGLKSIEEHVGTTHYVRLRMGIGNHRGEGLADYVLGDFAQDESAKLEEFIERGTQVLLRLMKESAAHVMTAVNVKQKQENKNESSN